MSIQTKGSIIATGKLNALAFVKHAKLCKADAIMVTTLVPHVCDFICDMNEFPIRGRGSWTPKDIANWIETEMYAKGVSCSFKIQAVKGDQTMGWPEAQFA